MTSRRAAGVSRLVYRIASEEVTHQPADAGRSPVSIHSIGDI